ncbi:unnamed protein product [Sphenostylis stenocarpa]|uniref:Uncharacterized protein n=1 Tax=Sphenostylis stenocarpa TaxID=92480 RepID=A0AA86RS01_9FABA|nr:unnamed protein product [Sphenostylis stenocarpa]
MVTIHSSVVVLPSEVTPSSNLSLSLCDQIKLPNHGSELYIYANTRITDDSSFASMIHTLSTSLSKTLSLFHPFAGSLSRIHGGRFQLLCNAKGAVLVAASCYTELSFEDLFEFAPTYAVPKINYDVPIEEVPLLVAQVTRFPCGFVTLGLALCRAIVDGTSVSGFVNSWAKLARGESLDSGLIPLLGRTKLDSFKLNKPPRFGHPEFLPPPSWTQRDELMQQELGTAMLVITKGQVRKLKYKACDFGSGYGKGPIRGYTSFEVLSGHLWRCVCKVRYSGDMRQPTRLTTLVNCRNRLRPSLPTAYFGNATFPTVTETCSFDDIMQKPLGYAVGKVREAIERMRDEYVRSALDYIACVEDMDLFRDTFYNSGGKDKEDPNLYVVGWTNFASFATDFGWGKPVCLLPGNIKSNGKAFILDTASGDGFVVAVCLQASYIDALKKLFYDDIEKHASKL